MPRSLIRGGCVTRPRHAVVDEVDDRASPARSRSRTGRVTIRGSTIRRPTSGRSLQCGPANRLGGVAGTASSMATITISVVSSAVGQAERAVEDEVRQRLEQHPVLDAHRLALGAVDDDDRPSASPARHALELRGQREARRRRARAARTGVSSADQRRGQPAAASGRAAGELAVGAARGARRSIVSAPTPSRRRGKLMRVLRAPARAAWRRAGASRPALGQRPARQPDDQPQRERRRRPPACPAAAGRSPASRSSTRTTTAARTAAMQAMSIAQHPGLVDVASRCRSRAAPPPARPA